jgi:hypothetical protein
MSRIRSKTMVRMEESYIFYTCLMLVLAIAAFGIVTDIAGR